MKKYVAVLAVLVLVICSAVPAIAADELPADRAPAAVPGELQLQLSVEEQWCTIEPGEDAVLELPAISGIPADSDSTTLNLTWLSETDESGAMEAAYVYENGEWTIEPLVIPADVFPEQLGYLDIVTIWVHITAGPDNTWTDLMNGDGVGTDIATYEYYVHGPAEEVRGELIIRGSASDMTSTANTVLPGEDAFLTMPAVSGEPAAEDGDLQMNVVLSNEDGDTQIVHDVFQWEDGDWSSQAVLVPAEELTQEDNVFTVEIDCGPGNIWKEVINGEGSGTTTATFTYHVYVSEVGTTIIPGAESPISIGTIGEVAYAQGLNVTVYGMTPAEYLELLDAATAPGYEVCITGVGEDGYVGTGTELQLLDNQSGEVVDTALIVMTGDVLGTGRMTLSQIVRLAQAYTGAEPLTGAYLLAGDWTGTGAPTLTDLVREAAWYVSMIN